MSSAPLVSFVMPVWIPQHLWLQQAISSVLGQRDCRLELILVDDGCPVSIPDMLGTGDERVRLVSIPHGGPGAARNAGIAAAHGSLLRFVDCDDVIEERSTARLLALLEGEAVIPYGETVVCDDQLRPVSVIGSTLEGDAVLPCLCGEFTVRLPALLFPRSVVDRCGAWADFRVSGDWDFVLRALEHGHVRRDPHPALYYRRHAGSVSSSASILQGEAAWERILDGHLARHPEHRGTSIERRARAAMRLDRGLALLEADAPGAALPRLAQAARLAPVRTARRVPRALLRSGARHLRRAFTRAAPPARRVPSPGSDGSASATRSPR